MIKLTKKELVEKFFPIYFYRKHLDIAAKDLLGLDLAPHHRLVLRDWGNKKTTNIFFASRGMGKSVLLAIYYVLSSILYPSLKSMVIGGGGFRQGKMIMQECERIINCQLSGQKNVYYAKNSLVDKSRIINRDPSFWSINFLNGSVIYAIPLGASSDGAFIRGFRAHFLGEDEAFLIPSNIHQAVLDPMQNVLYEPDKPVEEQLIKNMLLMVSTCDFDYRDFYKKYKYYTKMAENDISILNDVSIFEFNIDDSYYITSDGKRKMLWGINYDKIVEKKKLPTTDEALWMAENKNIPLNIQGGYYDAESIEKCMNVSLHAKLDIYAEALDSCSAPCVLGIDTAPSEANTAFVVVKYGEKANEFDPDKCKTCNMGQSCLFLKNRRCLYKNYNVILYAYEENKMSQKDRILKIYELMEQYNIVSIALDARGGGYELYDLLKDDKYVYNLCGKKPIISIDDEIDNGIKILKLYTLTQDLNMIMAGYLKGLISNQHLLLPRPGVRPDNPRVLESLGHIEHVIHQIARIKAIPSGKGLKFEIESVDPKSGRVVSGRKDLYSALLYAVGRIRELVEEERNKDSFEFPELSTAVAFNM